MAGKPNNRRTQYTIDQIKEALLGLLTQKELTKITVTEICQAADINRGTFYLHFNNPIDLFNKIENEIMDQLKPLLAAKPHDHLNIWMTRVISVIAENKEATRIILKDYRNDGPIHQVFSQAHDVMLEDVKRDHPNSDLHLVEYQFTFFTTGAIGLIARWLNDNDLTTDQVVKLLLSMSDAPIMCDI